MRQCTENHIPCCIFLISIRPTKCVCVWERGVMHARPAEFFLILNHFKTQEVCIKAVEKEPWQLKNVPDCLKTQEMCDKAVRDYLFSLRLVPGWLVKQQQIDAWYDYDYVYNDNEMIEWHKGFQERKAKKAKIKKELLLTA